MSLPLFSVSQFTTWHQTFEQDVDLYSRLRVDGIEVCERKLSQDRCVAIEQLAKLRDTPLQITSVQPRLHALFSDAMAPEPHDPAERMRIYRATIDLFAKAFPGQSLSMVTISGSAPGFNFRAAHQIARKLYRELADYASNHAVKIMFEPLSPVLMNADTFICALNDALDLIDDVDRPNFGLMLDVWHVWNEPNLLQGIERAADRIFGVHVCDWPKDQPRHVADRLLPGDGMIDLPPLFAAVERTGYRGAYCLEIFSRDELEDSLWRADPNWVIRRGRDGFQHAWEARHAS